jgi:hypothetical protein
MRLRGHEPGEPDISGRAGTNGPDAGSDGFLSRRRPKASPASSRPAAACPDNRTVSRIIALLLALALLFQTSWAVAATYCQHENAPEPTWHFGHHDHVHQSADGKTEPGGSLAADDDCVFHHAGHPAIPPTSFDAIAVATPAAGNPRAPLFSTSAPAREPDRPQWLRLA